MPTDTTMSNLKINKLSHAQYQSATKGDEFYIKQDRDGIFFNGKGVELPPGMIVPFGGSTAPAGWFLCDGSEKSRTTYKALFDVIGTTYGAGDGSTTFNLPNFDEDFVVEKKDPTTGDPSWYRIYRSGYIEQGGVYYQTATSSTNVALIKEMLDTSYGIFTNRESDLSSYELGIVQKTTTSFTTGIKTSQGNYWWKVIGKCKTTPTYNKTQIIKY